MNKRNINYLLTNIVNAPGPATTQNVCVTCVMMTRKKGGTQQADKHMDWNVEEPLKTCGSSMTGRIATNSPNFFFSQYLILPMLSIPKT